MAKHRSFSFEFKRQMVLDFLVHQRGSFRLKDERKADCSALQKLLDVRLDVRGIWREMF